MNIREFLKQKKLEKLKKENHIEYLDKAVNEMFSLFENSLNKILLDTEDTKNETKAFTKNAYLSFEKSKNELLSFVSKKADYVLAECVDVCLNYIQEYLKSHPAPKGDKGDTYVLSQEDKAEIAKSIPVPIVKQIVEKKEIVIEKPVIVNEIREVAVPESAEIIAEKLNKKNESLSIHVIRGLQKELEDIKKAIRRRNQISGGGSTGGSSVWGGITGTLSDQTDLQTILDGKSNVGHTHTTGDITGLQEFVEDTVGAQLVDTSTVDLAYDDPTGQISASVIDGSITNAKLATVSTNTFKGRTTAGTGVVQDLTVTQATAMLNTFTSLLKGLAPASGGGTTNFLRADGTWAPPTGSSTTKGIAEVDFGAITQNNDIATVSVSDASVTATSYPSVTLYAVATTDHDPDDYMAEELSAYVSSVTAGVGFDISVRAPSLTWGKYKVTYAY